MCRGDLPGADRSNERRKVLPSIATTLDSVSAKRSMKAHETRLERCRIEPAEHSAEIVMAGNAMPQAQELPQEWLPGLAEQCHVRRTAWCIAPMISTSCRSCRTLSSRGSTTAAKQATNSSMGRHPY
jgi:hypothetical protein